MAALLAPGVFGLMAACAPILPMAEGPLRQSLSESAARFCDLRVADPEQAVDVFEPELAERLRAEMRDGRMPRLSGWVGAGHCTVKAVSTQGGSRYYVDLAYPGLTDRLDFWAAGQGRARDLIYGKGGGRLSQTLRPVDPCAPPYGAQPVLWFDERDLTVGSKTELIVYWTRAPGAMEPVPAQCVRDWRITGPGRIEGNGAHLNLPAHAANGATGRVTARVGDQVVTGAYRVLDPSVAPLVGQWSQTSAPCDGEDTARELIFKGDGRFSLTFTPFETYQDAWGGYSMGEGGQSLILSVTGGNRKLASETLVYTLRQVRAGQIELTGAGFVAGRPGCVMTFERDARS